MAGAFDLDGAPPGTLQWQFTDAEPWYLEVRASGNLLWLWRARGMFPL